MKLKKPLESTLDHLNAVIAKLVELKKEIEEYKVIYENSVSVFGELVKLEDPRIDEVLGRYGIAITNKDGTIIFPRKKKITEKPRVIWDSSSKKDPSKPN